MVAAATPAHRPTNVYLPQLTPASVDRVPAATVPATQRRAERHAGSVLPWYRESCSAAVAIAASIARGRRSHARAGALGAASGAVLALGSGALLWRNLARTSDGLPHGAGGLVRAYFLSLGAAALLVYVVVGLLAGLGAAYASGARTSRRTFVALVGVWAGVAGACICFSPTSVPSALFLNRLPFAVPVLGCAAAALAAGWAARVRWPRYAAVHAALSFPLFAPDPSVGSPLFRVPPPGAAGSVLLLGLDNVGRDGMDLLARRIAARARADAPGRDPGVRFLRDAVSPVPVTRLAWASVLLGRDPAALFELDTLAPADRQRFFEREPFLLTRAARQAGRTSAYITDDATTNSYAPGGPFDSVRSDAVGWQVLIRQTISAGFPLAEGYVGRWWGVGVANAPGGGGTWRIFRAVAEQLGVTEQGPQLVAAHAVALHAAIRPSVDDIGGILPFLSQTPGALDPDDLYPQSGAIERLAGATAVQQSALYARRREHVLDQTERFIHELTRTGHRENTLIVVFTDHGELFLPDSTRNLAGLHGIAVEPTSLEVGVIVLPPIAGRAGSPEAPAPGPDGVTVVRGLFPLRNLAPLATDFMARAHHASAAGVAAAGESGWLRAVERGAVLPTPLLPVRSAGRPPLGDSALTRGLRTLASSEPIRILRLWPGGWLSLSPEAIAAVHASSDVGWTDGRQLLSYAPLAAGGHLARCYEDGRLVREWVVASTPAHPYTSPTKLGAALPIALDPGCTPRAAAPVRVTQRASRLARAPAGDWRPRRTTGRDTAAGLD